MYFTCPACQQKSILFPTKALHFGAIVGPKARPNHFECTNCNAVLSCRYSPLPFLLAGALAQVFVLQSGAIKDLWIGGVLLALAAMFFFPIRERPTPPSFGLVVDAPVRSFRDPLDQGLYYLETRLLSVMVAILATWLAFLALGRMFPSAGAHAGGLILLLPVGIAAVLAVVAFASLIYRVGRTSTPLRLMIDGALVASAAWFAQWWL